MATAPDTTTPDTIILIRGLWMTPRSWEEVADYALDWAIEHAGTRAASASAQATDSRS